MKITKEQHEQLENLPEEWQKPKRENFQTETDFEEALGYWNSHQGQIIAKRLLNGIPLPQKGDDEAGLPIEQLVMEDDIMKGVMDMVSRRVALNSQKESDQ